MKISYIILTWNSEKFIKNCIESILNVKKYENDIIIVDNGSTDETVPIIEKIQDENNLKLIKLEKNYGTTISRNIALKTIKEDTDFICVLDSDTQIDEKCIKRLIEYLNMEETIGLIGPAMKNSKGDLQISARKFPTVTIKFLKACPIKFLQKKGELLENYKEFKQGINYVDYLISAFWLMKYETFKKIGMFDENIFYAPEDVDYCKRCHLNNLKCAFCPDVAIIHEYQRISKKKFFSKVNYEHLKGLIYYFNKYKGAKK